MKVDFAREIALKILYDIDTKDGYSNLVLDEYLNKYREKLTNKDINLISEIVYGTVTWKLTIDSIIEKYSKIKTKKMSIWVLNILRIGAYQILYLDKIPKSAAVNECVNLSKKYAFKSSSFINAILRKIEKKDYDDLNNISNDIERISKLYSMPIWIIEELVKEYSLQEVENICKFSNLKPRTTIRINFLKTNKENFLKKLDKYQIEYEETEIPSFIHLNNVKNIGDLDLFKQGFFTIQDIGAGRIGLQLLPKPEDFVLDACCAPGGKTTQLAEIMNNKGRIIACDIYEHRLKLVKDNVSRLGINIVETNIKDATIFDENFIGKFDKVLIDVPCLGLGVIKRKPDIKWQRRQEDIEEITKIQYEILKNCSKYIKIGGELVYSTCSILKSENESIINKWYNSLNVENDAMNFNYKIEDQETILPNKNSDGFFICKIRRIN